jgi:hypothetical protein
MAKRSSVASPLSWPPLASILFIFLCSITVYILTLNPSLFRNDSPETITACVTLGVSHPPSYPLHTLLGHLFSLTTIGNPAMNLNFFSALLGAFGVSLFALNLWFLLSTGTPKVRPKVTPSALIPACITGSLCFAFSESYWSNSLAAKGSIYILQSIIDLSFVLSAQSLIQDKTSRSIKKFYFLFFLLSLGFINHWPTQILLVLVLLALYITILFSKKNQTRLMGDFLKQTVMCFSIFFIVISVYLYLPLRSNLYPALNFNFPLSFHRFSHSIFRTDYSKVETLFTASANLLSTIQEKAIYISNHLINEFHPTFFVFVLLGLYFLSKIQKRLPLLFLLLVSLVTILASLLYLHVMPIEFWHMDDHLLGVNWAFGLLGGYGIFVSFNALEKNSIIKNRYYIKIPLYILALAGISSLAFFKQLPLNDQKREFLYYGYGLEAMKSMDKNAFYYAESDYDYFSILYLKEIEKKRSDITLFLASLLGKNEEQTLTPLQRKKLNLPLPLDFFNTGAPERIPVLYCAFTNGPVALAYLQHNNKFYFAPSGILIRAFPQEPFAGENLKLLDELWAKFLVPSKRSLNPINALFLEICAHPYFNTANYLKLRGDLTHWDCLYDEALSLIQEKSWLADEWSRRAEGDLLLGNKINALVDYENSAAEYLEIEKTNLAKENLQRALTLDPDNLNLKRALIGL